MYVVACVCFIWIVKRMCVGCFWTPCLSECSLYFKGRGRLCNFKMCVLGFILWWDWGQLTMRSATHTQTLFSALTCELTLITCRCVQDDGDRTRPPWI